MFVASRQQGEVVDPDQTAIDRRMLICILSVVAPCLILAWWLGSRDVGVYAAAELPDLSDAVIVEIRTMDGEVAMSGELRDRVEPSGAVEKDAALLGRRYDAVIGEIEIEIPRPGSPDPRQELEVDVISLRPRTSYQVFVNDWPAATFTTDDRGSVDVEFASTSAVR
jgi:hypothetical protein